MRIIITGGAGFIGSALVRYLIKETEHEVLNVDKLTYAGNLESLSEISDSSRYKFSKTDICDREAIAKLFEEFKPNLVMHLAAESHVDRSIDGPAEFINTNIIGTFVLLEAARHYYERLSNEEKSLFRFHHVSTDEVFGDLGEEGLFTEETSYAPSSPYSASKAASDHLVNAWCRTYNLPVITTNCSNNYGPYHFPEKLIPLVILNAMEGIPLPVYGDGLQVRDWLFVEDHARALFIVATKGKLGETYNIGGFNEKRNIDVVKAICSILNNLMPVDKNINLEGSISSYCDLITYVKDRPGHDERYAIDATKIKRDLGWTPKESFESGIEKTVKWYIENSEWVNNVLNGSYNRERLGGNS